MQDGGGGGDGKGGVSVRLTGFVLSLFVLEESDERLPRRLALQRDETQSETLMEQLRTAGPVNTVCVCVCSGESQQDPLRVPTRCEMCWCRNVGQSLTAGYGYTTWTNRML